ncbi:MAG: DUF3034 family protein [Steroidobacteraceae bacterium]
MRRKLVLAAVLAILSAAGSHPALAENLLGADQGKILLTAGFSDYEGTGGGGLVPLAFITGYGSSDSWGANAHYTSILLKDIRLDAYGVAAGLWDRVEVSYVHHELEFADGALDGLGVSDDVFGVKVKLFGDAIYNQDSWIPQLAVGAQYKDNDGIHDGASVGLPDLTSPVQLGAEDDSGVDYYLAATKVFLAQSLAVNLTLRYTEANQFGLLGFGPDAELVPEATIAWLLSRKLAIGAEYRDRPDNLAADDESAAWDVFVAWTPTHNISLVAAYLNIGSVLAPVTGETADQDGAYLSLQVGF